MRVLEVQLEAALELTSLALGQAQQLGRFDDVLPELVESAKPLLEGKLENFVDGPARHTTSVSPRCFIGNV